jgi:hypothetical protein
LSLAVDEDDDAALAVSVEDELFLVLSETATTVPVLVALAACSAAARSTALARWVVALGVTATAVVEPVPLVAAWARAGIAAAPKVAAHSVTARARFRAPKSRGLRCEDMLALSSFGPPTGLADGFGRKRSPYRG